jgi:hypothetical protein
MEATAHTVSHNGWQTVVHEPVFMGLLRKTRDGFGQADWTPRETALARIDEEVGYDRDGSANRRDHAHAALGQRLPSRSIPFRYCSMCGEAGEARAVSAGIQKPTPGN